MKTTSQYSYKSNAPPRQMRKARRVLALVALIAAGWNMAICPAAVPPPPSEPAASEQGVQVLTRGPVHEAFAGTVVFNPEPGVVVPKAPPSAIEEVPPGERPVGNNVTWIPGYWAWDEERIDFLWVSGTWRALPPGRQWMAGYWGQITDGYQWTSGYWEDSAVAETTYLSAPPATVEDGPNVAAPSADYRWTPGNWIWNVDRFAWGPGYWARGRADWDWSPSHYVWTPRGYIFVSGYWDYPVSRRGSLFAPVYFDSGVYSHAGYAYSPSIAIDLAVFAEALFLRPRYNHYYFGDYYDNSYQQNGYYSAFAYQTSGSGYDPIYSQQRWSHRHDSGWNTSVGVSYQYRRDHISARPPRTWAAQQAVASTASFKQNRMLVATPLAQMASGKNSSVRYQAVTKGERQVLSQRGQQVALSSDQRRTAETKGGARPNLKPGELMAPSKVEHARSPIVAKAANQLGKGNAPPAALRSPNPQAVAQPLTDAGARLPKSETTRPQPGARKAPVTLGDKPGTPQPRQPAAAPGDKPVAPQPRQPAVKPGDKPVAPQPRQPAVKPGDKPVTPQPRQPAAQPGDKPVAPQPRQPAAVPGDKPVAPQPRQPAAQPQPQPRQPAAQPQPQPRQPAAQPQPQPRQPAAQPQPQPRQPAAQPQPQPQPRQPAAAPAAKGGGTPHGGGGGQPGEKDPKGKAKE